MLKATVLNITEKLFAHKANLQKVLAVTFTNAYQKFVAFLLPIILISKLGEHGFGKFGFVFNSMVVVSACLLIPFTASISRFLAIAKNKEEEALVYGELLLKVLGILVFVSALYVAFIWLNPLDIAAINELKMAHFAGLIYIVFILLVSFFNGLLLVNKSFRLYNSSRIISVTFQLVGIYLASIWFGIIGVVLAYGLSFLLQFVIIYLQVQNTYKFNIVQRFKLYLQNSDKSQRVIFSFILPNSLAIASIMLASWWGNVKLIALLGYTEVGFISVLMQLQIVIAFVPDILNAIMLPKLSKLFVENRSLFFARFKQYMLFVLVMALVGSAIFYFFARPILQIYSSSYANLFNVLQVFCMAYVLNILISAINQLILSSDNIWWTLLLNLSWVMPFVLLLEPNLVSDGLLGYAYVYNTAYAVQFTLALVYFMVYLKKNKVIFKEVYHGK